MPSDGARPKRRLDDAFDGLYASGRVTSLARTLRDNAARIASADCDYRSAMEDLLALHDRSLVRSLSEAERRELRSAELRVVAAAQLRIAVAKESCAECQSVRSLLQECLPT